MATRVATTRRARAASRGARAVRVATSRGARPGDDARREALRKARAKLPIDAVVDECLDALEVRRRARAPARRGTDEANDWVRCEQRATRAVMQAPPGAGKTTVMPLAAALAAASAGGDGARESDRARTATVSGESGGDADG